MTFQTTQLDQWTGSAAEIETALEAAGADKDASGQFCITPPQSAPALFETDSDILVTNHLFYLVLGEPKLLVDLLVKTTNRRVIFNQPQ